MAAKAFPPFAVTVDLIALTVLESRLAVLVVRRGWPPYAGAWALPGGFVEIDEDLPDAAARELAEETGVEVSPAELEQVATYGVPDRDPRMRTVSVAYLAVLPATPQARAGSDAADAVWRPVADVLADGLAFDHARILDHGVERARAKLEYTNLATRFVPEVFTISELRAVYDVIWGVELDPGNFHRKVVGTPRFVVDTGERRESAAGRPARTFRAGPATTLNPPLTRISSATG